MGDVFIDVETKGFTDMTAAPAAQLTARGLDKKEVSPALAKLLEALKEHGNVDKPTEVVIAIAGKTKHVFTIKLQDLREIQEILHWTIGQ